MPVRKKNRKHRRRRDKRGPEETRMLVAVRVRPLLPHEIEGKQRKLCSTLEDKIVVLEDPDMESEDILRRNRAHERRYAFDKVFGEECDQHHVYSSINRYLIDAILAGINATVFAYGATGAGKTFTMLGTRSQPGVMFLTLQELFRELEKKRDELVTEVQMTYVEIYNETLRDLLVDDSPDLDLREDASGNPVVCGAHIVDISSPEQVMRLLYAGNTRRTQEATAANATSSRSHAILEIVVRQSSRLPGVSRTVQTGRLFMCDLAGSERAAHTKNTGMRMVEGSHINRSLLALGNCINALCGASRVSYVNYRDSKLTRLLKESLSGNCKTVMIAHISPSEIHFEETYNTLNYANRAKNIKTTVVKNTHNVDAHITEYTSIIADLRDQVAALQQQLAERPEPRPDPGPDGSERDLHATGPRIGREATVVNSLEQAIMENFDAQLQLQQRLFELQDKELELHLDLAEQQTVIAQWLAATLGPDADAIGPQLFFDVSLLPAGAPSAIVEAVSRARGLRSAEEELAQAKAAAVEELQASVAHGDEIEASLPRRVAGAAHLKLLQRVYEMHSLQLANMELTYACRVNKHVVVAKDTVIQRLLQQQRARDALIAQQRELLLEHLSSLPPSLEQTHAALLAEGVADRTADLQPRDGSYLLSSTGSVRMPFPARHRTVLPPIGGRSEHECSVVSGTEREHDTDLRPGQQRKDHEEEENESDSDGDDDEEAPDSVDSDVAVAVPVAAPRPAIAARTAPRPAGSPHGHASVPSVQTASIPVPLQSESSATRAVEEEEDEENDADYEDIDEGDENDPGASSGTRRGPSLRLQAHAPTNLSSTFTLSVRRPVIPAPAAAVVAAPDAIIRAGATRIESGEHERVSARDSARAVESMKRRLGQPVSVRNARAFASPAPAPPPAPLAGPSLAPSVHAGSGIGAAMPRRALKPPPRAKPLVPKSCLTGLPLLDIKVSPYAVLPRRAGGPRYL